MSLTIEQVTTPRQLQTFIKVAWQVYQNDPHWVPWLYFERLEFFDKTKNPFFEHSEANYFIARRHGKPVGSIAAILNRRHNEFHNENTAHFGVFEVLNDQEAAHALLERACQWARDKGANKIVGPASLSTNDECGMLIDGFDGSPVLLMTYNPPYYVDLVESAGFTKAMDLYAWLVDLRYLKEHMPAKIAQANEAARQKNQFKLRPIQIKDWDAEIARIHRVYNSAWEKNWGFVPMTDREINHLADGLRQIVDPRIVFMAEHEGNPIAFGIALPNVNEILHRLRPGPSRLSSYVAGARMLWSRSQPRVMRAFVLGVVEEYRNSGVGTMLYLELMEAALRAGYAYSEGSWILETNTNMNRALELLTGKIYRRYRMYEKNL